MYNIQTKKRKNSRSYDKTVIATENIEEIKKYMLDNDLKANTDTPYFFTHITTNKDNFIITNSFREIITDPSELLEELKKLNLTF